MQAGRCESNNAPASVFPLTEEAGSQNETKYGLSLRKDLAEICSLLQRNRPRITGERDWNNARHPRNSLCNLNISKISSKEKVLLAHNLWGRGVISISYLIFNKLML